MLLMGARLALSIDAATKELERIVGDHRDGDCVIADGTGMVSGMGGNGRGDGDECGGTGTAGADGVVGRGEGRGLI